MRMKNLKYRIAIVGGAGFIGKSLAMHLSKKFQVKILDVQTPPEDLKHFVDYTYCDIRNYQKVSSSLTNVDLVVHTAIMQIPLINEHKSLGYEVNVKGTQNICEVVEDNPKIKGLILAGTWHIIGERDLHGIVDEEFGLRPDKVEGRARLYALSKMAQESIVRYYDEMSPKIYGIIRMGTVLGEGMPSRTAASIFIKKGLRGEPITPYRHSMHRPMLYVDVKDICRAYEIYASNVLSGKILPHQNSLAHIVNVYYPQPITILDLSGIIRRIIIEYTEGKVRPTVKILDKNVPSMFKKSDKNKITVNIERAKLLLELDKLRSPEETLSEIIRKHLR